MNKAIRNLRNISFGLAALLVLILVCATILEKLYGTSYVSNHIYSSLWFVGLWGLTAASSLLYLIKRHAAKHRTTFLLHLSFLLILLGALVTYLTGVQGSIHLRQGETPVSHFQNRNGHKEVLPFAISLKSFHLDYYPGTFAPMDYTSTLTVTDSGNTTEGKVSMNHIYNYRHYRFYQSAFDADGLGSTLSISYDPYGIALSYSGYAALLLAFLLFFSDKHSHFRQLLRHPALKRSVFFMLLCGGCLTAIGKSPHTLPRSTADKLGKLYVYYNDRICPLQTLAKDFTTKLYGKPTYKGLTSEQVFAGWFFYYDEWKEEPLIQIKNGKVKQLLGIEGSYARLSDFSGPEGYKIDKVYPTETDMHTRHALEEANEKFSIVSMVCTGNSMKIYPFREKGSDFPVWYSIVDDLPLSIPQEQWTFIRYSLNYVAEKVAHQKYEEVDQLLDKIKKYQEKEAAGFLPSHTRFRAERIYNSLNYTRILAMCCLTVGILSFIFYCHRMVCGNRNRPVADYVLLFALGGVEVYLLTVIFLRGIVSGHIPLSNGYETMQFMAACVIALAFCLYRKLQVILSFGYLLCGLALLVAMMGEANPPITQLMPVLSSPLLSIHVMSIMVAYSLLAFAMLNGITALILNYTSTENHARVIQLQVLSQLMMYPAVFLLTAGIFIGAVWANVSWGRYWGWDPKEVWALITLLIYAAALHTSSLPLFRNPVFFHWFAILAFLSVLITYFGVNFVMGGMHSYA